MDLLTNYASSEDEEDNDIAMTNSEDVPPPPPTKNTNKRTHDAIQGPVSRPASYSSKSSGKKRRTINKSTILSFAPPQLSSKKKNVSTEDLDKWNSKKTNLKRKKKVTTKQETSSL
tara:strand:- start:1554 stop:1901 length:348 start_codon:yes stop_codon:yes gene_type:complete